MMMYYASCDANGPISVRMADPDKMGELATCEAVDACTTHAEDDLGFCGEGMSEAQFGRAMEAHGAECVDSSEIAGEWRLWRIA